MRRLTYCLVSVLCILFLFSSQAYASEEALLIRISGAISPATEDYIERGIQHAAKQKSKIIILQLDTPGGLDTSMRGINQSILASAIPVAAYVAPTGARAASAGTFILYASHIAAMAPGTNIGAASPINLGEAKKISEKNLSTPERKQMNDAAAYMRGLAQLRDRNAIWAEQAVRDAVSLSADEALKLKVIDVIAKDVPDLLQKIQGHVVKVRGVSETLATLDLSITEYPSDWRYDFLSIITNPNIAYILLLLGIYGLFFEFYNPGFVLPGVVGAISLLLALYAFQLLPINYVGFALLLLGISFMIVEVMISSLGILGVGGVVAFVVGSILLLDINSPGYQIAWSLIAMMTVFTTLFFLILITLAIRAARRRIITGREALVGSEGEVYQFKNPENILVKIQGETWQAQSQSQQLLQTGQKIRVLGVSGLVLHVTPINPIEKLD